MDMDGCLISTKRGRFARLVTNNTALERNLRIRTIMADALHHGCLVASRIGDHDLYIRSCQVNSVNQGHAPGRAVDGATVTRTADHGLDIAWVCFDDRAGQRRLLGGGPPGGAIIDETKGARGIDRDYRR